MRRSGGQPGSLDSKNVLPVPVAEGCVLFKYEQPEPLSCFPEHLRKKQYFSLLKGFCFASANASKPLQPPASGKFSPAEWEYHTFVVTIENGDRLYGHCLRFYDLQSHANATLAIQPSNLSVPDSIQGVQRATPLLLNSAMCVLSKFPLFDSLKKWLVHVCKEAYAAESDSTSFSSIHIEPRIINLVTEIVAIHSNTVATQLSLTSTLVSSGRVAPSDIHNILIVFEALLFGEQILVLSDRISLLSLACESLISLIFPMSWPFSYVPVFSNAIPIDYVGGLTPFLFGIVKSNPNILDPQGFLQVNTRVIVVDLDQNKIFHQTKPQRLPTSIRQTLVDKVQRLIHPELSACDFADADIPVLDAETVVAGIREAFFMVFVELFQGLDLKTTAALLEESTDTDQIKERKAYVSAMASQSAAYQYFVDYVQPDNILLSVLKLPRESVSAAINAALKGPSNFLTFNEPEPQRLETQTRPDVTCWDARLFYQPRFEFLSSYVEKIIASQPDLMDLYVLRVHYLLVGKRASQLVADLQELARVDPHNHLLECRDIFSTMFSQLSPDKVEMLSREQDRVGNWARYFYLHERRRTSQNLSPESLAMFKYVTDTPDESSVTFNYMVKKNLPALCCHKENMTLLMVAAAEWKLKMSYVLLKFNAASDFEGANGAAIHFFTSPRFKARSEIQYLLLIRAIGMLLARGDDIDRRDLYQFTGLLNLCHRASPSVPVIRFLLSNGADPNVFDTKGLSPMGSLLKGGHIDLAAAEAYITLLEYGANVMELDRLTQDLDAVAACLGSAILRDPQPRLIQMHNLASSKREAYTRLLKAKQEESNKASTSPKMSHQSGSAASDIVITPPSGQTFSIPIQNETHLASMREKISQMKRSTLSRKIQGLDPESGAKGVLLHSGVLSRVNVDAEDATEIRKQDLTPRQTFLFSLDIQKGYLVFCDEQTPAAINDNTSLVLRESYYLDELVPLDIPAFILPDGKESTTLCFQLVFVDHSSTSRHDSIILAAQTKDQKDEWLRLLWRLCIEGHAYSRNAEKYALYKQIGSSTTSFEGYLDYRTESMRVPWKCHYFVLSHQTLYAFQNSAERSEPILIIRLLEHELLTDANAEADLASVQPPLAAGCKLISLRPHQFYQPKYLFRFSGIPRAMVKPDPSSEWYSVLINFYDAHKMHSSAQANVSMAVGMAGLQPPPSPPMSLSSPSPSPSTSPLPFTSTSSTSSPSSNTS